MALKAHQVIFVLITLLLASGCQAINVPKPVLTIRPPGSVRVYTTKSQYHGLEDQKLVISNTTSSDISIPIPRDAHVGEKTYRFYRKFTTGWQRLFPRPGYLASVLDNYDRSSLQVPSASEFELEVSHVMGQYWSWPTFDDLEGMFMVQIRYEHDPVTTTTHELVQYSNEFIISRTAPVSITEIVVKVNQPQLNDFELENNSSVSLWLPSVCLGVDVYDNDDGFSSLQRLTSEGTWEIYRPLKSNCTGNVEAIFLEPGHSILVDTIRWLSIDRDGIAPGIYRWDVVFYLEHVHPPSGLLRDIRHIFSETFEYTR